MPPNTENLNNNNSKTQMKHYNKIENNKKSDMRIKLYIL